MPTCPSCNAEAPAGVRWCGICHGNLVDRNIGRLASPGKRLGAFVLDGLIPCVALLIILAGGAAGGAAGGIDVGVGMGFLLWVGYIVWAIRLFAQGTTPGKSMLGMRVVKEDGQPAGLGTMLVREWIGKWISGIVFSLGFLWILLDPDRQGWHDKLVSTYVTVTSGAASVRPPQRMGVGGYVPRPASTPPRAILCSISGPLQGRRFAIDNEVFRIGAGSDNDLVIAGDGYVSRHHASLRYDKGTLWLVDQQSRNGTFLNADRLQATPAIVNFGDRIRMGDSTFELIQAPDR
jgi:uncharacterized RDD family membrane protein YckC